MVIALVVTPDGFPLAYEVMPGNTSDNTTLSHFVTKIEDQYGRSDRVWIMDRGIPTEETLEAMRRFVIWWERPRAGSPGSRSHFSICLGKRCANRSM